MNEFIPMLKTAQSEVGKVIPLQLMESKEAKKRDELIRKFKEELLLYHHLSTRAGEQRGAP